MDDGYFSDTQLNMREMEEFMMRKSRLILGILMACGICMLPSSIKADTVSGGAITPAPAVPIVPVLQAPTEMVNLTLPPVQSLTCKASTSLTSGTVSWLPYVGASSYEVYRKSGKGEYQLLRSLNATSFTDDKLTPGTTYTYKVQVKRAALAGWELTPFSSEISMKMIPAKVKGFKAKAHRGSITLKWKKGAKGKVSGYEVWGKVSVKLKGVKLKYHKMKTIKSYKKNSLKHKMLVRGMTYNYQIRCYKTVKGKKIYSEYVTIKKKAK